VGENEAAHRLGQLISAGAVRVTRASTGRVNLIAEAAGLCKINVAALLAFNEVLGVTLATICNNAVVQPKKVLATLKIIPYAIPETRLQQAERIAQEQQPILEVKPFIICQATLIIMGSHAAEERMREDFIAPVQERLAAHQAELVVGPYIPENEAAISAALRAVLATKTKLIIMVGETSIMDEDDLTPRAIKAIGGEIVHHGVAVEPGNLFMLGYYEEIPIVGAPGCARSLSPNVIDLVLPRLLAGEYLTRRDLVELGHGGYLK